MSAPCDDCVEKPYCNQRNFCPTLNGYARRVAGSCRECGSANIHTQVENNLVQVHCLDCEEYYSEILDGVDY